MGILALDEKNNVLTVKQYRYVYGQTLLEIPAGKLEPGEDPYAAALRELQGISLALRALRSLAA